MSLLLAVVTRASRIRVIFAIFITTTLIITKRESRLFLATTTSRRSTTIKSLELRVRAFVSRDVIEAEDFLLLNRFFIRIAFEAIEFLYSRYQRDESVASFENIDAFENFDFDKRSKSEQQMISSHYFVSTMSEKICFQIFQINYEFVNELRDFLFNVVVL